MQDFVHQVCFCFPFGVAIKDEAKKTEMYTKMDALCDTLNSDLNVGIVDGFSDEIQT